MAYKITSATNTGLITQQRETATATLELVRELRATQRKIIEITDRGGSALTIADLQKLSDRENI